MAGVHAIFPQPVPYLDHSGMLASFPKANFFMTSWGMERYLEDGRGFVRDALLLRRAPLLIENRAELRPGTARYGLLLAQDRALIERFYQPYWGPVRIAGVRLDVAAGAAMLVELPFPGEWRLRSTQPFSIDGRRVAPGEVFRVDAAAAATAGGFPTVSVVLPDKDSAATPPKAAQFSVIWAGAGAPPPGPVPHPILYDRL